MSRRDSAGPLRRDPAQRHADERGDRCPKAGAPSPGGAPHSVLGNQQVLQALGVRAKLSVSAPGDADERQADAQAEGFVTGHAPPGQPAPCNGCRENDRIRRQPAGARGPGAGSGAPPGGVGAGVGPVVGTGATPQRGAGQPLPGGPRQRLERYFQADLSGVRLHTDAAARRQAEGLNARAFTRGQDIWFGAGPGPADERLLAHEVAHVVHHGAADRIHRDALPGAGEAETYPPGRAFYSFRGVFMRTDPIAMRDELRNHVRFHGIRSLDLWHDALNGRGRDIALPFSAHARAYGGLRVRTPIDMRRDMDNEAWRDRLAPVAVPLANAWYPIVRAEAVALLAEFQATMVRMLNLVLDESERRIRTERIRYGLKSEPGLFGVQQHRALPTPDFHALAGAAQDLLAQRNRTEQLRSDRGRMAARQMLAGQPVSTASLDARIQQAEQDYRRAKLAAAARHPALGAVLDESSFPQDEGQRLQTLALGQRQGQTDLLGGAPTGAAGLLGGVFEARQSAIAYLRQRVGDDASEAWSIAPIVALTQQVMAGEPTGMLQGVVKEKLEQRQFNQALWDSFKIVASLALALPTGGASLLVAGATLSVVQAVESIREYQLQHAMANSDLDRRAAALATEEPSAFWVALDVVFAVADAKAVLGAFRAVRGEARAALMARDGQEFIAAERRMLQAADAVEGLPAAAGRADLLGRSRLAQRLRASLARMRGLPAAERELGVAGRAEAAALGRSARTIAREGEAVQAVAVVAGHEVKVTRSGLIVICTECSWLRGRYVAELADDPARLARLEKAEARAAAGPLDAAAQSEIRQLTLELEQARKLRATPGAADLPKELADASALAPKAASPTAPIRAGESAPYDITTLKKRGVKGDQLTGDHIPSRAALVEAKQNALWEAEAARLQRPLTPAEKDALALTQAEKRQIRDQGLALVKGERFHIDASRTWGPRNNPAQIALDAADLSRAVKADFVTDLQWLAQSGQLTKARVAEYIQHYQGLVTHGVIAYSDDINQLLLGYLRKASP